MAPHLTPELYERIIALACVRRVSAHRVVLSLGRRGPSPSRVRSYRAPRGLTITERRSPGHVEWVVLSRTAGPDLKRLVRRFFRGWAS